VDTIPTEVRVAIYSNPINPKISYFQPPPPRP
jgi:hypothetical protein